MLRLALLLLVLLASFGLAAPAAASPDDEDDDGAPGLAAAATGIELSPFLMSGRATSPMGREIHYWLREAPLLLFPGQVDSNSPAFWQDGELVVFNSQESATRTSGPTLDALGEPQAVALLSPHGTGNWWLEAVWADASTGELYGWYHLEPDDLPCLTAPSIGAAVSRDNGVSWTDLGPVLESGYDIDCSDDNGYFVGGHGDFAVMLDQQGEYFYFLYSNYGGPVSEQGIGIARSAFKDRGGPGTVYKYLDGAWSEPGLGGRARALFPSGTGWHGPYIEAFWGPSVHWNEYLHMYVALLNRTGGQNWEQEGVYITFSEDLLDWSEPRKLLHTHDWYPQVVGLERGGTDNQAGASARVYVGGASALVIEFELQ